MLVHKGGQINNVQLITGLRIAEMSQLQSCSVMCTKNGNYCEIKEMEEKVRGEGECVQRMEVIVKRKKSQGGRGGQGRCEWRSEAFVKIQKKYFFWGGGVGLGGGGGGGQGGCELRSEAFVKIQKKKKNLGGGGGGGGRVGGVRVDVNGEVKLL